MLFFLMCRCLVTCYRHSDWTDPREKFSESLFLRNMPADSDVVLRQLSEKHEQRARRESEQELHVRSHEGFPRSPAVEAADAPCYLLARTCVLHFSSTQVPPFSCLHLSPPYRAMPHLDGLWDRLCGSDVNGGTGVLCWQGVRFLLNRLQGKQSRQDVSWAASYFHLILLMEKHRIKKLWAEKFFGVIWSFSGENSPPDSLEPNSLGFA